MKSPEHSLVVRVATRVAALVLRGWPSDLRRRYREAAVELFRDRVGAARIRSRGEAVRTAIRYLWDATVEVVRSRVDGTVAMVRSGLPGLLGTSVRGLVRRPGYTLMVTGTLAVGIALNASIFAVVNTVLLRPLPYPDGDELVFLWETAEDAPGTWSTNAPSNVVEWRARTESLQGMAAFNVARRAIAVDDIPEQVIASLVEPSFFEVLAVTPALGTTFSPEHGLEGRDRVVLLSYALWQRRFGGERSVVGRLIPVDGTPHRVLGVLPRDYRHPDPTMHRRATELFLPLVLAREDDSRFLRTVARLGDGVTLERTRTELRGIAAELGREFPERNAGRSIIVTGMREWLVGEQTEELHLLWAGVVILLLVVCVNLAGLVYLRARGRASELAVRQVLGAGPARVLLLVTVEVLIIVASATLLGLAAARSLLPAAQGLIVRHISAVPSLVLDARVVVVTLAAVGVSMIVMGLLPSVPVLRLDLRTTLGEGGRGAVGGRKRGRDLLVGAEVALTVILLTMGGLLTRSFFTLIDQPLGFDPEDVLTFDLRPDASRHPEVADLRAFYDAVAERLRALPAVEAVSFTSDLPFSGNDAGLALLPSDGALAGEEWIADFKTVDRDYFRTLGIPVEAGRWGPGDGRWGTERIAVVSRSLADLLWPGGDPVGRVLDTRVTFGDQAELKVRVVAVVSDLRDDGFRSAPEPILYLSREQRVRRVLRTVVKARDASALLPTIRREVAAVDDHVALGDHQMLEAALVEEAAVPRLMMGIVGAFGVASLLLTALGVYGVVANSIGERTREFGIRVALGAEVGTLVRQVLVESGRIAGVGAGVGVLVSLALSGVIRGVLFGVTLVDPGVLALAVGAALSVVAIATWLPAHRLGRLDPARSMT